jgi:hypothetical protein
MYEDLKVWRARLGTSGRQASPQKERNFVLAVQQNILPKME